MHAQMSDELPRYERPIEPADPTTVPLGEVIPYDDLDAAIAASTLTPGGAQLLRGLLRVGRPALFPGGGVGIEYGSLLKTATRPDHLAAHLREAAAHLDERAVDVLVVPGMSGYPVGAMYSAVSGLPAVLLKKQPVPTDTATKQFPPGSFVIPSYTGEGDVVMSADLAAVQDIVDGLLAAQVEAQAGEDRIELTIRIAGADDIVDKATMSQAVSESALVIGRVAITQFVDRLRTATGDLRPVSDDVQVVTWVTPLVKAYTRPRTTPFAGLTVTSIHRDPPALGIEGLGLVGFRSC